MPALFPSVVQLPEYNALALAPVVLVALGGLVCVLLEAFLPRRLRHQVELAVAVVALVAAFLVLALRETQMLGITMAGSVVMDGPTVVIQMLLLVLSLLALIIMSERFGGRVADAFTSSGSAVPGSPMEGIAERRGTTTEIFPLTLFSVSGMMLFPAAGDLLTMFIALELLSLPLYVLTALGRRRRLLSQEAALKYFLLGSFSSAFFLFGAALLYGFAGSVQFGYIADRIATVSGMDPLLWMGSLLVLVGLLFKVGAVPFHSWTPDVYQGAPTPVTGFMAACTKVAAFGALLRVGYTGIDAARWDWQVVLWIIAGLTMILGSLLSVTQTDIKRMLAYSSIAHAGFILVGFLAFSTAAVGAVIFYLAAYGFATIAAFGLVMLVRATEDQSEATSLTQWEGLGRRSPLVAGAFSFLLMAFAGIPLTSGFTAKFAVFGAAISGAGLPGVVLAVIGVLCSAVTAFVYFRVIWLMYFADPDGEAVTVFTPSVATVSAIALGVVITFALGVFPTPLLDLTSASSLFLR
ncbi:NADH-quinone oxidoreductase subunit NuoN [Gephyromycinifex aptenodytis]|uniref:NADH-quinone oxidoreductase subunit NuoN n=1 Tax=Gephyromycinifex aptenodytis TaxID=2716227 RepID=UPI0014465CFA|nr:NADH-quinone oxidoreductase subunit NuoN [Gephyromycinifex aptenodytis]